MRLQFQWFHGLLKKWWQMDNKEFDEIRGQLAKGFWQAFEYASPVDPLSMSKFVLTWFELNGYEIKKSTTEKREKMKVTIYSKPNCVQCEMTKRLFRKEEVEFDEIDVTKNETALELVGSLGYSQAPVVVAGDKHWSGFRIEKIKDLALEIHAKERM
jgi:glutaredoxin-like protein NrdH